MNYYNFHIGDYASHTRGLSLIEDLAYRRILDLYYLSEKPLTGEYDVVAKNIGMPEFAEQIEYILVTFFEHTPHGFINKRADAEIEVMKKKQESARQSANKRWKNVNKMPLHSESIAIEMPSHSESNATKTNTKTNTKLNNKIDCPENIPVEVWNDYLSIRKAQKKPITDTALKGLKREAEKAKISLFDVLTICCERGWVGFKAEWIKDSANKPQDKSWMMSNQGIEQKAQELGVNSYGVANHQQLKEKILQVMAKRSIE
jgi:uncharacterized protein YdaU (DUF1376 family)